MRILTVTIGYNSLVKFLSLSISNFKGIREAYIDFKPGLYKVSGYDTIGEYSSNGTGKSSLTQALIVCLFNSDPMGANLVDLIRRGTSGYKLEVKLIGDDNQVYTVINHRSNTSIVYRIKGVTSTARETTKKLTDIIGMTYQTYLLTSIITQQTVTQLIDNLRNPSLFNDILQITQLKQIDTNIKNLLQQLSNQRIVAETDLIALHDSINTSKVALRFDRESLEESLELEQDMLNTLKAEQNPQRNILEDKIRILSDELVLLENQILTTAQNIEEGICSTCGTILADTQSFKVSLAEAIQTQEDYKASLENTQKELAAFNRLALEECKPHEEAITQLTKDLHIALVLDTHDSESEDDLLNKLQTVDREVTRLKALEGFFLGARKEISSGRVTKELMDEFFIIVTERVVQYSNIIKLNGVALKVITSKLGMEAIVSKDGEIIPINTLSNGERGRVALVLLVSILDAIKIASNTETNFLVFDEAVGAFDQNGHTELEHLFNYMKESLGMSIFTITHGNELDKINFDYELKVIKDTDGSIIELEEP